MDPSTLTVRGSWCSYHPCSDRANASLTRLTAVNSSVFRTIEPSIDMTIVQQYNAVCAPNLHIFRQAEGPFGHSKEKAVSPELPESGDRGHKM